MCRVVCGRWYIAGSSLVKKVNNLCFVGVVDDYISTNNPTKVDMFRHIPPKTNLTNHDLPCYHTPLYTPKTNKPNLLNNSFTHYPQSLLIRLKNKIKERL